MDARELRLGNYVYVDNLHRPEVANIPLRVIGLYIDNDPLLNSIRVQTLWSKDNFGQAEQYIRPIPLTEELLEKCSLHNNPKGGQSRYHISGDMELIIPKIATQGIYVNDEWQIIIENYDYWRPIVKTPYLHQLQNAFFLITGKDLTINL